MSNIISFSIIHGEVDATRIRVSRRDDLNSPFNVVDDFNSMDVDESQEFWSDDIGDLDPANVAYTVQPYSGTAENPVYLGKPYLVYPIGQININTPDELTVSPGDMVILKAEVTDFDVSRVRWRGIPLDIISMSGNEDEYQVDPYAKSGTYWAYAEVNSTFRKHVKLNVVSPVVIEPPAPVGEPRFVETDVDINSVENLTYTEIGA